MNIHKLWMTALASTALMTGCGDDAEEGSAQVTIINAVVQSDGSPNAGGGAGARVPVNLDAFVDGAGSASALDIEFAEAFTIDLSSGSRTLSLRANGGAELLSLNLTLADGEARTLVVYSDAADFTQPVTAVKALNIDNQTIAASDGNAAVYAVHVDGNSQGDSFQAYAGTAVDSAPALGNAFGFEGNSGVYSVSSDFNAQYLDSNAGNYDPGRLIFDNFICTSNGATAGGSYILVWGTNSVAAPGETNPASNAFLYALGSSGVQSIMPCGLQPRQAQVRFVHAVVESDGNTDAGFGAGAQIRHELELLVDGATNPAVTGFDFAEGSETITALNPGDHTLTVQAAGGGTVYLENGTFTLASGGSHTVIVYNNAADFTQTLATVDLFNVDESTIETSDTEAGILAVHLDGNSQSDPFWAYDGSFDASPSASALGAEFGYQQSSEPYLVNDLTNMWLDADGGTYGAGDSNFVCSAPALTAGQAYILVWGTNSVALPGETAGSSNAFVIAPGATGPQTIMPCLPQ